MSEDVVLCSHSDISSPRIRYVKSTQNVLARIHKGKNEIYAPRWLRGDLYKEAEWISSKDPMPLLSRLDCMTSRYIRKS